MRLNILESMEALLVYRSEAGAAQPDPERPLSGEWSRMLEWPDMCVAVKVEDAVEEIPPTFLEPQIRYYKQQGEVTVEVELEHKITVLGLDRKTYIREETDTDKRWRVLMQELDALYQHGKAGGMIALTVRSSGHPFHQVYLPLAVMEPPCDEKKQEGSAVICIASGTFRMVYGPCEDSAIVSTGRKP